MKDFDVYTAEGDPLSDEDMPLLRPQRPQHHKEM